MLESAIKRFDSQITFFSEERRSIAVRRGHSLPAPSANALILAPARRDRAPPCSSGGGLATCWRRRGTVAVPLLLCKLGDGGEARLRFSRLLWTRGAASKHGRSHLAPPEVVQQPHGTAAPSLLLWPWLQKSEEMSPHVRQFDIYPKWRRNVAVLDTYQMST